jgi:hypothetical protein
MKPSVAISLIIMGSIVIITPPISDYLLNKELVELVSKEGVNRANLDNFLSGNYRLGCWLAGLIMIVFAVYGSLQKKSNVNLDIVKD